MSEKPEMEETPLPPPPPMLDSPTTEEVDEFFQLSDPSKVDVSKLDLMVVALQEQWDVYEVKKKAASEELAKYEKMEQAVIKTLDTLGKSKYFVDGLGTISLVRKLGYETPKGIAEKNALYDYVVREYGVEAADGMFSVNSTTLNAWAKKENEAKPGMVIPGLKSPTERVTVQFRSARK